jgi:hypothetical protein
MFSLRILFMKIFRKEKGKVSHYTFSFCCRNEALICFPKEMVTIRHKAASRSVRMYPDAALAPKPDVYKVNVEVSTTNNYECESKQIQNIYLASDPAYSMSRTNTTSF